MPSVFAYMVLIRYYVHMAVSVADKLLVNIVINFPCYFTLLRVNSSHENDGTRLNKSYFGICFF